VFAPQPARLIDVETGKVVQTYGELPGAVQAAGFSASGEELYLGLTANVFRILDARSGEKLFQLPVGATEGMAARSIMGIQELSPRYLVLNGARTSSQDETTYLLDRKTRKVKELSTKLHTHGISQSELVFFHSYFGLSFLPFSQAGEDLTLGGVSAGSTMGQSYFRNYGQTLSYTQRKNYRLLSPSGDHFIADDHDQPTLFSMSSTGIKTLKALGSESRDLWSATDGLPGGAWIAHARANGVEVWRAPKGTPLTLPVAGVKRMVFSPGGELLALATPTEVLVYSIHDGQTPERLRRYEGTEMRSLQFSADGRALFAIDIHQNAYSLR